jgi:hypothetical protein
LWSSRYRTARAIGRAYLSDYRHTPLPVDDGTAAERVAARPSEVDWPHAGGERLVTGPDDGAFEQLGCGVILMNGRRAGEGRLLRKSGRGGEKP